MCAFDYTLRRRESLHLYKIFIGADGWGKALWMVAWWWWRKSLEVQEDRRRIWCLLCKSHKQVRHFNAKAAQNQFSGILYSYQRYGPKYLMTGSFCEPFNKWCASSKWADQVIYCCEMAFVTASFIHFALTKDWFQIWSWLNYSWILY